MADSSKPRITGLHAALAPPPSAGLFPTLWPADHGDTARRKFVMSGGLPAQLDASRIRVQSNADLPYAQWMYTRNDNELYVYGVPANVTDTPYFARVDARSFKVMQKISLPWMLYMGGALIHRNGDVYLVQGPLLYRFKDGDLDRLQKLPLPQTNGVFTQYNGMTVMNDGRLVLKGWSINHHDLGLFQAGLAQRLQQRRATAPLARLLRMSMPFLFYAALRAKGANAGVDWQQFFNPREVGCLVVVDADTLKIEQTLTPPERLPFARMAVAPSSLDAELGRSRTEDESLVIPGEEFIHRWHYSRGKLSYDSSWAERYRHAGDGSFVGTGPALWRQHAHYTDNTAPLGLGRPGYRAYRKSLAELSQPQMTVELSPGKDGFMFWSTVVDPLRNLIFVWDSANAWIEARGASDLNQRWRVPMFNADCAMLQAHHGHLYCSDHSLRLSPQDLMQSTGRHPKWPHVRKDLVVLNAADGSELLRVALGADSPVMSMIVPGFHNDVFVSRRSALLRVVQT